MSEDIFTDGKLVGPTTEHAILDLLGIRPGERGGVVHGQRSKIPVHVLVNGEEPTTDGYYPCKMTAFDPAAGEWDVFAEAWAKEANGRKLFRGRYIAVFYGYHADGKAVYRTQWMESQDVFRSVELAPAKIYFIPEGCALRVFQEYRPVKVNYNEDGYLVSVEQGSSARTEELPPVPLSEFCHCCESESSDSDSDSSDDGCEGWYCCQETGEVVFIHDCEQLFHYSCEDSSDSSSESCTDPHWHGPGYYCIGFVSENSDGTEGVPTPGDCVYATTCEELADAIAAHEGFKGTTGFYITPEQCLLHCEDPSDSSGSGCDFPGNGWYCRDGLCEYWADDSATSADDENFCYLWHENFDGHDWSGPFDSADCCNSDSSSDSSSEGGFQPGWYCVGVAGDPVPTYSCQEILTEDDYNNSFLDGFPPVGPYDDMVTCESTNCGATYDGGMCGCDTPPVSAVVVRLNTTCLDMGSQDFVCAWNPDTGTFVYDIGFPAAGGGIYRVEFDPSGCTVGVNGNCPDEVGLFGFGADVSAVDCDPLHLSGEGTNAGACCNGDGFNVDVWLEAP